jgi:hypothetical protein
MGAWGTGSFDNDTALDWTYGLEGRSDLSYVEAALDKVLAVGTGYLEAPASEKAIAAAEAVARLQGHFGVRNAYTEALDNWVGRTRVKPSPSLIQKASQALIRIQQAPSELMELWEDDVEAWHQAVAELASRLGQ